MYRHKIFVFVVLCRQGEKVGIHQRYFSFFFFFEIWRNWIWFGTCRSRKEKRNEKGKKRKGYEKAHWKKQMKYLRKQKKQSWKGIMHGSNSLRVAATIA